ncbi:MAG TPA: metalloregulator ArsR/SmtB family transcription factor [Anaerolineae bacterium]
MVQEKFDSLLEFFKVLGNESRLKILGLLANEERSVGELAETLGVKEPTVSHHLAMMKGLGLVSMRAEGNVRVYQLNTRFLEEMNKDIFTQENLATLIDDTAVDAWERKVLQNFLDGERIKAIPAQYKKQQAILKWLANKFEMGIRYPESEVNEIIKRHHPDSAWFRRSLVDQKFMAREKGVYWRLSEPENGD